MDIAPSPPVHRRADLIAAALIVVLVTVWFADVVFFGRNFFLRDVTRYYYPIKQVLRRVVLAGEFPYWNRFVGAGQPLAANPEFELFYPPTWLLCAVPYYLAFRALILGHVLAGLLGTYLLLRGWKCRPETAVYGAVAWGLGGGLMSLTNLLEHLTSAAWVPLILLAFDRLLTRRTVARLVTASVLLGVQLLVCEPTVPLQCGILVLALTIFRLAEGQPRTRTLPRDLLLIALAGALALAVSTPAWLTAVDLARDGVRAKGLGAAVSMGWSAPPVRLAEFVYPNILGHIGPNLGTNYWGRSLYPEHYSPFYLSVYCGLLTALCAAGGLLLRRERWPATLAAMGLCMFLALGIRLTPSAWVWRSPLLSWLRYPEKFVFTIVFLTAVFGALMLERILAGDETLRRWVMVLSAVTAALAAALWLRTSFSAGSVAAFARSWEIPLDFARLSHMAATAHRDWLIAALRGLVAAFAVAMIPRMGRGAGVAMVGLLVADLVLPSREITPTMPENFFHLPPIASSLPDMPGAYRLFHVADVSLGGPDAKVYFTLPTPSAWIYRNGLYPEWPAATGIESALDVDASKTNLMPTVAFDNAFREVVSGRHTEAAEAMLGMSNVWFRGVLRPAAAEIHRHPRIEDLRPVGFIGGRHYPRYYFADRIVPVADATSFLRHVVSEPALAAGTAFIEGSGFNAGPGRIMSVRETANSAHLVVRAMSAAFLVMSVTPHKYWTVTLDGERVRPVITNIGYQGIGVPAGDHTIVMTYRNPLVAAGTAVSAVSLMLLLTAILLEKRRRRSGQRD